MSEEQLLSILEMEAPEAEAVDEDEGWGGKKGKKRNKRM
jgi:hypothetical protein